MGMDPGFHRGDDEGRNDGLKKYGAGTLGFDSCLDTWMAGQ